MNTAGSSVKSAESLAKKRARDRRAQQNQRDKRNEQIKSLQEQLTRMESLAMQLTCECESLRQENKQLRARQDTVSQVVKSWDPVASSSSGARRIDETSPSSSTSITTNPPSLPSLPSLPLPPDGQFWSQWSENTDNPVGTGPSSMDPSSPPSPPPPPPSPSRGPWANIPIHTATDIVVTEPFTEWLQRPDLARSSPDQPQPTELLYGSKTNFLANLINQSLRSWPCRDPERLAAGWLIYQLIKWILGPSPERYARLQGFQHPVPEQLSGHGHAHFVDFVHWPALRARMIRHAGVYNPQDVLGMYLCCVKLRWPWGQNFLEPEVDGTLRMRQDFLATITRLDGWGLTDDFLQRFPLLTQDLDVSAMRYRVC